MKLRKINFDLDWPVSIEVTNLRKHVLTNLMKKGEVIRWSIIDIQTSKDSDETKKLRIHAVLAD